MSLQSSVRSSSFARAQFPGGTISEVGIRPLNDRDSLRSLTKLIRSAYASLGGRGLNFNGVDQKVETTSERIRLGICLVAENEGNLVGTILVHGPFASGPSELVTRADSAYFQQFAVHPDWSGSGLGTQLLQQAEAVAAEAGYAYLCTDTAVEAADLVAFYRRRGYEPRGEMQWPGKTYRSVVVAKPLIGTM